MEGLGTRPRLSVTKALSGTPCGLASFCRGGLMSRGRERIAWHGVTTSGAWLALQGIRYLACALGRVLWPGNKTHNE